MKSQVGIVLLVSVFTTLIHSYPTGAPGSESVCSKMSPGHGAPPQKSSPPYRISVINKQIRSGDHVKLTLAGDDETFKGFFCQARDKSTSSAVGEFVASNDQFNLRDCFGLKNSAATHKDNSDKSSLDLMWNAQGVKGEVHFVCTFLKDFDTYWRNVVTTPFIVQ